MPKKGTEALSTQIDLNLENYTTNMIDKVWLVIVWDDPVNLMSYVTYVFQKLFGYSKSRAEALMLQVHNEGKSMVYDGSFEKAEAYVKALHEHGLWATMEQS